MVEIKGGFGKEVDRSFVHLQVCNGEQDNGLWREHLERFPMFGQNAFALPVFMPRSDHTELTTNRALKKFNKLLLINIRVNNN